MVVACHLGGRLGMECGRRCWVRNGTVQEMDGISGFFQLMNLAPNGASATLLRLRLTSVEGKQVFGN